MYKFSTFSPTLSSSDCYFSLLPITHTHRLCELVKLQSSCKKLNLLSELMDHSGDYVHTVLPYILSLLQRGLGQRIVLLTHSLCPDPEVGMFYTTGKTCSSNHQHVFCN